MRLVATAMMVALFGCGNGSVETVPGGMPMNFDYRIPLPEDFTRDPDARGIDSKVEAWNAPAMRVWTDLGAYGAPPDCSVEACERDRVDGFPAILARRQVGEGARIHLHLVIDEPHGVNLNIFAECDVAVRCEELVPVLMATDILVLDS